MAILAHEMVHYYLMTQHNLTKSRLEENELLTEIATVYVGFGLLLYSGYKAVVYSQGPQRLKSKVGYVSREVVESTIIKTAYIRKQNPIGLIKSVGFLRKLYYYQHLKLLIGAYRQAKRELKVNRR